MSKAPVRTLRVFRYAMYFDEVDDYVDVKPFPLGGESTVEAWFHDINIYTNYWGTVFGWFYNWNNYAIMNHQGNTGRQKYGYMISGVGLAAISSDIIPSRFVHGTGVFSASKGFAKLYWDATVVGSRTFTPLSQPVWLATKVCVGHFNNYCWFNGYIVLVRVYSRALSEDEIAWNYNNPDNPIRDGLVLWLQANPDNIKDIDGDGVLEWVDLSGYNNHGKIYGATLVEVIKAPSRVLAPSRILPPAR